jgi:SAM-dependent methyltransferase
LGCALIDLHALFGERLILHGLNKHPAHGSPQLRQSVLGCDARANLIHWAYADSGIDLPYPSLFFDLVFSQSTIIYVEDKLRCLSEIRRVLRTDGEARLDNFIEYRPYGKRLMPIQYGYWLQIADRRGPLDSYAILGSQPGVLVEADAVRPYVHMVRGIAQSDPLHFISAVRLEEIDQEWYGTQSYYMTSH